jgi:hypothetical protein
MDGFRALKVGSDDVDEKQNDPARKNDDPWQEAEGFIFCRGHRYFLRCYTKLQFEDQNSSRASD